MGKEKKCPHTATWWVLLVTAVLLRMFSVRKGRQASRLCSKAAMKNTVLVLRDSLCNERN
jgi:hypothetical protein